MQKQKMCRDCHWWCQNPKDTKMGICANKTSKYFESHKKYHIHCEGFKNKEKRK